MNDCSQKVVSSGIVSWPQSLLVFAADIKLSHSIFAMPFVATGFLVGRIPVPSFWQAVLIVVCMISARSFAMGMNRYLDAVIDAKNTRTAGRAIPSGRLAESACLGWSLTSALLFVVAALFLSKLAGMLAIPMLLILGFYSKMKRISWLTHWYLGVCLGLAPIAAEIAVRGSSTLPVIMIGVAVSFWTAGFDLLYSLQDLQFDRETGLHSLPARFGPRIALVGSVFSFCMMVGCLLIAGGEAAVGVLYYAGVAAVTCILIYEHWLVRDAWAEGKSSNINAAFFNANAFVSILIFIFCFADRIING